MQDKNVMPIAQDTFYELYGNKIIPFPGAFEHGPLPKTQGKPILDFRTAKNIPDDIGPILARPGEKLLETIPDFRPLLQRDGLILLSWDKRFCAKGARYTAYWVTSHGILRYYASPALSFEIFPEAIPNRKSYAAEDGIDFYGEPGPLYIVHVAPELMMSSNQKLAQRPEHIKKLKALGIEIDFDYSFLLTTERKKSRSIHKQNGDSDGDGNKRRA